MIVKLLSEEIDLLGKSHQGQYLSDYLKKLGAQTYIVEDEYIDWDYLIDYSMFYARTFDPISKYTRRLHFFSIPFSDEDLHKAILNNNKRFLNVFKKNYCGFVIIKPVKDSNGNFLIGRTVLQPLNIKKKRQYSFLTTTQLVSLYGIQLIVKALPFQGQDRAVGACATTAVWISLSPLIHHFGVLKNSLFEITKASVSFPGEERNFPSSGLNFFQIKNYFNLIGFELEPINIKNSYLFNWDEIPGNHNERLIEFLQQKFGIDWIKTAKFKKIDKGKTIKVSTEQNYLSLRLNNEKTKVNLKIDDFGIYKFDVNIENNTLKIYRNLKDNECFISDIIMAFVGAGLPLIAALKIKKEGIEELHAVVISGFRKQREIITELYVHDDQIGPYDQVVTEDYFFKWKNEWITHFKANSVIVEKLFIPIYPKIRLTFTRVYKVLLDKRKVIENKKSLGITFNIYLFQVNDYKNFLLNHALENKEKILLEPMPRFLWIIRTYENNKPYEDLIYDGTSVYLKECCTIKYTK